MKLSKIQFKLKWLIIGFFLATLVFVAYSSRVYNKTSLVGDYDPWFQYRHAKEILENNLIPPKWDLLSFFPPGRPFPDNIGWMYTMIIFYKIISIFSEVSFMEATILSPAIMVGLTVISGFLLGKELSNEWGGLATGIFAAMAPSLIGVSMAGYCDTDSVVVFYSLLSVFSILLAMRKRKIFYYVFSVIVNLIFIFNWWFGWYVQFFFLLLIPSMFGYKVIDNLIKTRKIRLDFKKMFGELKPTLVPLLIVLVATSIISFVLGMGNVVDFIFLAFGFRSGGGMVVNVSVAELQPINILTKGGFNVVASRVDYIPLYFMLFGLPILVFYKFYRKEEISFKDIFLFMWAIITFYMILSGIRFSLLFSVAVAASAGYVIGNIVEYIRNKDVFIRSAVYGVLFFLVLFFTSRTLAFGLNIGGMDISQNWIDMFDWLKENADEKAIVSTWWDPGHIIVGYTNLRVHADGAHCSPTECVPYNHNIRIQNMGRIMSTSDEGEAVEILEKYMNLDSEDCEKVKEKYGDIVPEESCEPVSEMYFISSSDLIGKFTWMNYFGGYRAPIKDWESLRANPGVCCAQTPNTEPEQISCGEFANQGKGVWVWCPWIFNYNETKKDAEGNDVYIYLYSGLTISIIQKGGQILPVYNNQYVINNILLPSANGTDLVDLSDSDVNLDKIDGLIIVEGGGRSLIYLAPAIKESVFVKTFFFEGKGLDNFELVFSNPEIRLFRVNFD